MLCELMNTISPGSAPTPSASEMPFRQMGNIAAYADAARRYGVPEPDMFVTVDLFEGKNVPAVVQNLHSLGRVAQQQGFAGPACLGARLASKNVRRFSQAQLDEARAMPARWTNNGGTLPSSPPAARRAAASPESTAASQAAPSSPRTPESHVPAPAEAATAAAATEGEREANAPPQPPPSSCVPSPPLVASLVEGVAPALRALLRRAVEDAQQQAATATAAAAAATEAASRATEAAAAAAEEAVA